MKDMIINEVPCTTWNWMKINKDSVCIEAKLSEALPLIQNEEGFCISNVQNQHKDVPVIYSGICSKANPKACDNRRTDGTFIEKSEQNPFIYNPNGNHPVSKLIEQAVPCPQFIKIEGKKEKPLILNFNFEKPSACSQFIYAEKDSESTVIFVYKGKGETSLVQTKVFAQDNAKIHIIKVQMLENNTLHLDDTGIFCNDDACVQFIQIELGGLHVDSGLNVTLNGYKSTFNSNAAYLCQNNQYLDMNHIVNHYGKKTECNMKVNGTLKDSACKTYRGTIDFKNGCCGAKGNEMEESLVLSPSVVNKSLPNILCDEEDVEGEHGATIGRLSNDILFYMQSRGISTKEAEKLMARAKIQACADLIPDENVKNQISEFMDTLNI